MDEYVIESVPIC